MTRQVTILEVDEGSIRAGCDRSACEGCKGSLFCRGQNSEFEVANPKAISVDKGDKVVIDMPAGRTILASAMSLVFPLACFLAGMLAAFAYDPDRELVQLACGVAGLAAGFALSSLYFHFTKRKYTPTIDRKLEE